MTAKRQPELRPYPKVNVPGAKRSLTREAIEKIESICIAVAKDPKLPANAPRQVVNIFATVSGMRATVFQDRIRRGLDQDHSDSGD